MSLEKAIKYGKEKRKPYRNAKAVSKYCRNHGGCSWCEGNRLYKNRKRVEVKYENQMQEMWHSNRR